MVDLELILYKKEMGGRHDALDSELSFSDMMYGSGRLHESQDTSSFDSDLVVSAVNTERMLLHQDAAHDPELRDKLQLLEEAEAYLRAYNQAEHDLEGSQPPFSEMIDTWVHDSVTGNTEVAASDLEYAQTYQKLLDELYEDYRQPIEAGDIEAAAEWDVVENIIDGRIVEYTNRDMITTLRHELGLAA